jgi:hypothetical protein
MHADLMEIGESLYSVLPLSDLKLQILFYSASQSNVSQWRVRPATTFSLSLTSRGGHIPQTYTHAGVHGCLMVGWGTETV